MAYGFEEVALYTTGKRPALVTSAALNHPADYEDVAPTVAALYLRDSNGEKSPQPIGSATLKAGRLYTLLVFQGKDGKPKVKTIEDDFSVPQG